MPLDSRIRESSSIEEALTLSEAAREQVTELKDTHTVHITNEDDGETVKIGANNGTKISEIITEMYTDFRVERHPNDRLRCLASGENVFPFEHLTMKEYLQQGHCPELKWAFASETGGA